MRIAQSLADAPEESRPRRPYRWKRLFEFSTLPVIVFVAWWNPLLAQDSEYSLPKFNPEHDFSSALPVENVDTFSGALTVVYTDFDLPGPSGFDLKLVRWYNSKINTWDPNCISESFEETSVGIGWQMHMGRLWDNPITTNPVPAFRLELPGGEIEEFYHNDVLGVPNAGYLSKRAWVLRDQGSTKVVISPQGIEYDFPVANSFNPAHYLYVSTIKDLVGNQIQVTYANRGDSNAYIDRISDAINRQVSFGYNNNNYHLSAPAKLSYISTPSGTIYYNVDEPTSSGQFHNVLASFTTLVSQTTYYDYSIQSGDTSKDVELKRISLPTGGTIGYTYARQIFYYPLRNTGNSDECTRVVTTKNQSGYGNWSYQYPSSNNPSDKVSVVTDPSSNVIRYTYGRYTDPIWQVGLLQRRQVIGGGITLLDESLSYSPQQISTDDVAPGTSVTEYAYAGLLTQSTRTLQDFKQVVTRWGSHNKYQSPGYEEEYDFNQALYRKSTFEYAWAANSQLENAHVIDRVSREETDDSGGAKRAETIRNFSSAPGGSNGRINYEDHWVDSSGCSGSSGYQRTSYTYDFYGDIASTTSSGGGYFRATTNLSHTYGILSGALAGGVTLLNRTVDYSKGTVASQTGSNGGTTSFSHDAMGRLTGIYPPLDAPTTISYSSQQATVSQGSSQTVYSYDQWARLTRTQTYLGSSGYAYSGLSYDTQGNVATRYGPSVSTGGGQDSVTYDFLGRPTYVSGAHSASYTWGSDRVVISDATGSRTIIYDAFGRIVQVSEPGGGTVTSYAYDVLGNLARVTQPGLTDRVLDYNSLGWLLSENNPESGLTCYNYNLLGDLTSKVDADNDVETFYYDNRGRLTQALLFNATPIQLYYDGAPAPGQGVAFNGLNELTGMSDETGSTTWSARDTQGRITEVQRLIGGVNYVTNYGYDDHGNIRSIDYPRPYGTPSRTAVTFTYNAGNLQETAQLTGGQTLVSGVLYNPARQPKALTFGNGVTVSIPTSDSLLNKPQSIQTTGVRRNGQPSDLALQYGYDTAGRISSTTYNGRYDTYSYLGVGLLTNATYGAEGNVTYNYDVLGNITLRQSAAFPQLNFSRSYSGNRIAGYQYSPSGNLTSDGAQTYSYRADNKLSTATGKANYWYDGQGNRVRSQDLVHNQELLDLVDEGGHPLARLSGTTLATVSPSVDEIYVAGQLMAERRFSMWGDAGETLVLNPSDGGYPTPPVQDGFEAWTSSTDLTNWLEVAGAGTFGSFNQSTDRVEGQYAVRGDRLTSDYMELRYTKVGLKPGKWYRISLKSKASQAGMPGLRLLLYNTTRAVWMGFDGVSWTATAHDVFASAANGMPALSQTYQEYAGWVLVDPSFSVSDEYWFKLAGYWYVGQSVFYDDFKVEGPFDSVLHDGVEAWTSPTNLTNWTEAPFSGGSYNQSSDTSEGSYSVRANRVNSDYMEVRRDVTSLLPGQWYRVSFDSKGAVPNMVGLSVRIYNVTKDLSVLPDGLTWSTGGSSVLDSGSNGAPALTTDYQHYSVWIKARPDFAYSDLYWFRFVGYWNPTDLFYDNVSIVGPFELPLQSDYKQGPFSSVLVDEVLEWQNPVPACPVSYEVQRATNPAFSTYSVIASSSSTVYRDRGVRSGSQDYYYRVKPPSPSIHWFVNDHRGSVLLALDSNGSIESQNEYFPYGEVKRQDCTIATTTFQGFFHDDGSGVYNFGARFYGDRYARFLTPDTTIPDLRMPIRWNRYLYSSGDPLNLVDVGGLYEMTAGGNVNYLKNINFGSDGHGFGGVAEVAANTVIGTVSDWFGVDTIIDGYHDAVNPQSSAMEKVWGTAKVVLTVAGGEIASGVKVLGRAGVEILGSRAVQKEFGEVIGGGARLIEEVGAAQRGGAAAVRVGQAGEDAVRMAEYIGPLNKLPIRVNGVSRVPDGLTETVLTEVKNVAELSLTAQLRDYLQFARDKHLRFDLWVRGGPNGTKLSGPLWELVQSGEINLRTIP